MDPDSFWEELSRTLMQEAPGERNGLVFLHGYKTSFAGAAIRAAQIGYDLRFPGVTAFFSWPSRAKYWRYPADEAAIEASEHLIAEFLIDFATRAEIEKTHIIAHSMGNRGLLRALQRITSTVHKCGVKFGQIILAAPDIDCDTFRSLAHVYKQFSERTTLYTSNRDNAVGLSRLFHDSDRVGRSPPVTVVSGVDTIEVPSFDLFDVIGHTYFAEAEALLHDVYDLLRDNQPPTNRQRLIQASTEDKMTYWIMER